MEGLGKSFRVGALRLGRVFHRRSKGYSDYAFQNESCPVCGQNDGVVMYGVLWPDLVLQWGLSAAWANWVDQREGLRCRSCGSNLRCRQLGSVITHYMNKRTGAGAVSLSQLCTAVEMKGCAVAEFNSAGALHQFLAKLDKIYYSEYGSTDRRVPSEDLMDLSLGDQTFDVVVNSDVLEHVPNVEKALSEIYRVLKPDGLFIFTVPLIWERARTRRRAKMEGGKLMHMLEASYHGQAHANKQDFLVFYEFGRDFVRVVEEAGFSVELIGDNRNPSLITLVASKSLS